MNTLLAATLCMLLLSTPSLTGCSLNAVQRDMLAHRELWVSQDGRTKILIGHKPYGGTTSLLYVERGI
jgi:hypothetical protein